jgi:hypothetical protein
MLFLIYLQGVDLKIKGSHSHNQKSIDSNIGLVYNRKQSASAALRLKNKPKRFTNIDADASFKWNDQEFVISNTFEQNIFHSEKKSFPMNVRLMTLKR